MLALRIVFLVVSKEGIELNALFEIFCCFKASNVLQKVEVSVSINTSTDKSVPVNTLQFHIGMVLLEVEVHLLAEINVRALDGVHVFTSHLKLVKVEVFREHLHLYYLL